MFKKIRKAAKRWFHKVSGNMTILEVLGTSPVTSTKMRNAIALWSAMYENRAQWLHDPTQNNPYHVVSLGLPAAIASEKAKLATLEFKSEISAPKDENGNIVAKEADQKRAEFLNKAYQKGVVDVLRTQTEYAVAKGGLAITPYIVYDGDTPSFAFDYTQADRFIPLGFDTSGKINDAAFVIVKETPEFKYTRLERQTYSDGVLNITNRAFKRDANVPNTTSADIYDIILGEEIQLTAVPEWAKIPPEDSYKNVDRVFFAYVKMPNANTVDEDSPLGVSGFSRAVAQIQEADELNAILGWEFEAGRMAIEADSEAFRDGEGNNVMPSPIYRVRDTGDAASYNAFAPQLRDASYINGLEYKKSEIEYLCGLSRGTISHLEDGKEVTAYQLKIQKQATYSEIASIQQALQAALEDIIYIMDAYCTIYDLCPGSSNGICQASFEWDDSIVVDAETEMNHRIMLKREGVESRVGLRMWYYGETREKAIEALKKVDADNRALAAGNLELIEEI